MPAQEVQLPELRCYRCAYNWTPRKTEIRLCPRCKSRYWDLPRLRKVRLGHGEGIKEILEPHLREIHALARKYHARRLRVFGSVRRREAKAGSDVDLIVDWIGKASMMDFLGLGVALEKVLHRKVDLVEEEGLHWFIRPQVLAEAVAL